MQDGIRYIQIEDNSKVVTNFVIRKSVMPWRKWMLIQDTINSSDDCQEVRINHAHQEANRVAYAVLVLGIVMDNFSHGKTDFLHQ